MMPDKTYLPEGESPLQSQIGTTVETLAEIIAQRKNAPEGSYTFSLLSGPCDDLLKKVIEEAAEVVLAAKDVDVCPEQDVDSALDHLRYEIGDVFYHLLVVLERYHIPLNELAAELNTRMTDAQRPSGALLLRHENIKRGH